MNTRKIIAVIVLVLALFTNAFSQSPGVAINTDGATPHASAMLDVSSTTKGFLPPRMTNSQKNSIASPVAGLLIWFSNCGTSGELQIYNGTTWTNFVGGTASAGKPDAPVIGTTTVSGVSGTATVTFTQPASNGGAAIISYTATSTPGGLTATLSQAGSGTITFNGLTNGTAYTFTVTATNSAGTSVASAASNSVTPYTVPGAPTIGTATATDGQATVTFT
ncbi:MAG: fibronectin type III domain-containing protein, partial [Mariniphaga sp.]